MPEDKLHISIPTGQRSGSEASPHTTDSIFSSASFDSLFDDDDASDVEHNPPLAVDTVPPIPGLHFNSPTRISRELEQSVMDFCKETYFRNPGANQVMLFGHPPSALAEASGDSTAGLPPMLLFLLDELASLLRPTLPDSVHSLLFPSTPTKARQAIINLYAPGEGITPHVDLLGRYADGIIGVSFGSGCVMRFDRVERQVEEDNRWDVFLPERSIIVLSGEARYGWTHGIDKRTRDLVSFSDDSEARWVDRGLRLSVTFRWMLDGADVLR